MIIGMGKLTIWIPNRELEVINRFCQSKSLHLSPFLWKSAVGTINRMTKTQSPIKCDLCRSTSVGKFKVFAYEMESGGEERPMNLCKLHLEQASKEGEVTKL